MKTVKAHEIISIILLILLIVSFVYGITGVIYSGHGSFSLYNRLQMEFVKITLQCIFGIIVLFLPSALERKFKISFPGIMHVILVVFIYAAIILGQVSGFYQRFYHWDTLLHTLSGIMLSAFGFCIIDIVNKNPKINLGLSDWFMAFFSFCFAIMLDTIWEIMEFAADVVFDLNMQQYNRPDGTVLTGHSALVDTMKDLIVDVLGALFISIIGYIVLKKRRNIKTI
jgi:ABC-type transport system involved in multi-copper enzyme maturation permease subunit